MKCKFDSLVGEVLHFAAHPRKKELRVESKLKFMCKSEPKNIFQKFTLWRKRKPHQKNVKYEIYSERKLMMKNVKVNQFNFEAQKNGRINYHF